VPSQTQWWSNFKTQLLQTLQWLALGGRKIMQVSQNLNEKSWGLWQWLTY